MSLFGGLLSAGGSLLGGLMGSNASSDAAEAEADAQRYAADLQRYMYDQNRQDYMPYMGTGGNALAQIASLYGLYQPQYFTEGAGLPWNPQDPAQGAQGAMPGVQYGGEYDRPYNNASVMEYGGYLPPGMSPFGYQGEPQGGPDASQAGAPPPPPGFTPAGMGGWESSPEYQMMQDALRVAQERGGRALDRSAAAGGGLLSGAQAKALTDYAMGTQAGYMSGAYGDYLGRLMGIAGLGGNATSQVSQLGANAASNMGNAAVGAGNAQAAGIIGSNNAWGNAINQGLYGLGNNGGLANLFNGAGNTGGVSGGPSVMPGIGSSPSGLYSASPGLFFS